MKAAILCLLAASIPACVLCDVFAATAQLAQLIETQEAVIEKLDNFISQKDEIVKTLLNFRNSLKAEHDEALKDIDHYVQNPINAFTIIKRLTVDINNIACELDIFNLNHLNRTIQYPTEDDLVGASESVARLQETYNLKTSDLAAGKIYNKQYSIPMTSSDCFELGRALYDKKQYFYSSMWFMESLKKFDGQDLTITKSIIYEYLDYCNYAMHDLEESLKWLEKCIEDNPKQEDFKERKSKMQQEIIDKLKVGEEISYQSLEDKRELNTIKHEQNKKYEAICRGDYQLPTNYTRRLVCRYDTKGHPYLKIAPFKVEEMYLDPYIAVYHNVMSDGEIEHIIGLAMGKLKRSATVMEDADGNPIVDQGNNRVSKVSWLLDTASNVVAHVSRRAGHMAQLTLDTAEILQANTYGIGGHYMPHFDMVTKNEISDYAPEDGNRITTVLFYMSDVLLGGATAFIELGISVAPKKGSAVVWRNLLPSLEADLRTLHAACPVILGSKWVANKWFHEGGQEFVAPCNLEYQREEDVKVSMKPILTVTTK